MPELPEVQTTLNGIKPFIVGQTIIDIIVRRPNLRWPIPLEELMQLRGEPLLDITRRAKYLLFHFPTGILILHLGMSGKVKLLSTPTAAGKHDHLDILFDHAKTLRFNDPRRFGALLWSYHSEPTHPLLGELGVEPLTNEFSGDYLWQRARGRKTMVKSFLMNAKIVAGVGNIYATEALFEARIHPQSQAGALNQLNYQQLAKAIKSVLTRAIKKGGTSLRDFSQPSGTPGYFSLRLKAYGREGKPCPRCKSPIQSSRISQRSSAFCPRCQKIKKLKKRKQKNT